MIERAEDGSQSLRETTIRAAAPGDAECIARVHIDTWRSAYQGILPDEYLTDLSYEKSAAMWSADLSKEDSSSVTYVAEAADSVVGFAGGGPEREGYPAFAGELYGIYVLQSHQRRGIGRRLVGAVGSDLVRRGFHSALVWVLEQNPCKAFYEALGGKRVGRKEAEIGGVCVGEVAYGWTCLSELIDECARSL
ncbi:MAG: GNAT family N-acetyltransferase [Candidatus Brocadiia bacterium]